jgi:hypothetical protein
MQKCFFIGGDNVDAAIAKVFEETIAECEYLAK